MIFRAIAYIVGAIDDEVIVYVDAGCRQAALERLSVALHTIWRVGSEQVEHYNLADEHELIAQAGGEPATGDARLLEVGWADGRPSYAPPERTLLLLGPRSLRRMVQAQQLASLLPRAVFTVAA